MVIKNRVSVVIFLLLLCSTSLYAQQKNFIERTLDWGYKIVQGDSAKPHKKYFFVIPILSYKPETRWVFGLSTNFIFRSKNNDSITRPSTIRLNVTYSQNRQSSIKPFIDYYSTRNKINIHAEYLFTDFLENFWGVGNDMPKANKELYDFQLHRVNVKAGYSFRPKLYAGPVFQLQYMNNVQPRIGGLLDTGNFAGGNGYFAMGAGAYLSYDSRDNIYFPFSGSLVEVSGTLYNKGTGSNYAFNNVSIDARKYWRLWNENVLAFQGVFQTNNGNVPFRMLATIGSDMFMRGYYNGRFRDNNLLTAQTEFRKTIWGPVSMTAFVGFGGVSNSFENIFDKQKLNLGLGLRMKAIPREHMNMRLDVGFMGDGSKAVYITMGEAF